MTGFEELQVQLPRRGPFRHVSENDSAWLGDFVWMRMSSHLVLSPSTFSWWAGFLGEQSKVYVPILPAELPLPWCWIFPQHSSWVFYDVWNQEAFNDADQAMARCLEFSSCREADCPMMSSLSELVKRLYPELLHLQPKLQMQHLESHKSSRKGR